MVTKNSMIEMLAPYVNEVIEYSQGIPTGKVNSIPLLEKWYEAKKHFIDRLDGRLIYEFPETISVNLTDTQKETKAVDVASVLGSSYGNKDLCDFVYSFRKSFFDNKLPEDYKYKDIIIPKGMKLIKAFKYFEDDKKILSAMQDYASTVIQENKVTGKFCISVHPLDFLSSSENTYKWRSCHALNGEYRAGNLSYMCDSSTVICYLKGEDDVKLPNFPGTVKWNSKKWRMLLFFSDYKNIMFAGRQYPFFSKEMLTITKRALIVGTSILSRFSNYVEWTDERLEEYTNKNGLKISFNPCIPLPGKLMELKTLIKDEILFDNEALHFNDLLYSSCYIPYYSYNIYSIFLEDEKVKVGCNEVPCLICGKDVLYSSESCFCEDCHYKYEECEDDDGQMCDNCGSYSHDLVYVTGTNEYLCGECLDELCSMCEECGEFYLKEDVNYDPEDEKMICRYCKGEH